MWQAGWCGRQEAPRGKLRARLLGAAGQMLKDVVGSSYYVSPECLKGSYSFPTDLWSAGVIIYIMLSGLPPFNGANTREVFRAIVNQPLNLDCDPWQVRPPNPWRAPPEQAERQPETLALLHTFALVPTPSGTGAPGRIEWHTGTAGPAAFGQVCLGAAGICGSTCTSLKNGASHFHVQSVAAQAPGECVGAAAQEISAPGKDFVRRLLEKDPRKRLRVTEALAHPWVCVLNAAPKTRLSGVVVERLVAFTRSSRLERALLNLVAKHLSRSDIGHLEAMFKALDTDGDGCAPPGFAAPGALGSPAGGQLSCQGQGVSSLPTLWLGMRCAPSISRTSGSERRRTAGHTDLGHLTH